MRNTILDSIIEKQNDLIYAIRRELKTMAEYTDLYEDDIIDPEGFSNLENPSNIRKFLKEQLDCALEELKALENGRIKRYNKVEEGAIVITNNEMIFFIGVPFLPFVFESFKVVGLAVNVPVYSLLKNKKINSSFVLGEDEYRIENIV